MTNRGIPSAFLRTTLHNGIGRYVCQLQRLTIKFCKEQKQSRGVRDFIENGLVDFAKNNPSVAVYAQVKRHRSPALVAEYLNGKTHIIPVAEKEAAELLEWLDFLRTRSGEDLIRMRKSQHTFSPSIQGAWTPVTNKQVFPPDFTFPNNELFQAHKFTESATDILQRLARKSTSKTD
ncbi:mRpL43 [Bugula neritina]|uniref:Large ribosomal subunit protein mL43 n=1 Tax=Bugula neritina TaxID=10212 RepID=A0A7J7KHA2_BUGNE|nr:mRpL43 [Bugula neritina]